MALMGIHAARPDLKIGAIVIDSHFDLADVPEIGASSFWYRAFQRGMLEPTNLCPIGIRGNRNPRVWGPIAKTLGMPYRTMADIDRDGIVAVARHALQSVSSGVDALYISLDVDVIDPAFQPGQKYPDAAGLTAREVMLALRTLIAESPVPLAGYDVAGYSPHYDVRYHGAIMVARSVVEVIGGLAARKASDDRQRPFYGRRGVHRCVRGALPWPKSSPLLRGFRSGPRCQVPARDRGA